VLRRALALAVVVGAFGAQRASGVVDPHFSEPADGATVPSRPLFVFAGDPQRGSMFAEISVDPTLRSAGDRVGAFVEPSDSFIEFFGDDPALPDNAARWDSSRIPAGRWYWHAQVDTYSGEEETWSRVRTFVVADEPPILEGWTARLTKVRGVTRCRARRRLSGVVQVDDNDASPRIEWVQRVVAGGKTIARFHGSAQGGEARLGGVFCSSARRVTIRLTVRDPGGHRVHDERTVALG
jgi:hypothetical protein